MKATTNESDSQYQLDVADADLCHDEGCSWALADGVLQWVCCCNKYLCNTGFPIPANTTTTVISTSTSHSGVSTLKPTNLVLISALMIVIIPYKKIKLFSFIFKDLSL
jgi:hypothetical protein